MNLSESDRKSVSGFGPDTSWIWTVRIGMYPPMTDRVKREGHGSLWVVGGAHCQEVGSKAPCNADLNGCSGRGFNLNLNSMRSPKVEVEVQAEMRGSGKR